MINISVVLQLKELTQLTLFIDCYNGPTDWKEKWSNEGWMLVILVAFCSSHGGSACRLDLGHLKSIRFNFQRLEIFLLYSLCLLYSKSSKKNHNTVYLAEHIELLLTRDNLLLRANQNFWTQNQWYCAWICHTYQAGDYGNTFLCWALLIKHPPSFPSSSTWSSVNRTSNIAPISKVFYMFWGSSKKSILECVQRWFLLRFNSEP